MLARREAVLQVGGFEEAFRGMQDDQAFYAKMLLHYPAYVEAACWAKYRQHPASMCAVAERAGQVQSTRQVWLNWLEGYIREHQISDRDLHKALRQALLPGRRPAWYRLWAALHRWSEGSLKTIKALARRLLPPPWYARLKEINQRLWQAT